MKLSLPTVWLSALLGIAPLSSLSGCTAGPGQAPGQAPLAASASPGTETRVGFRCDTDETIEVRFLHGAGRAVLLRHGQSIELRQQPAASGFIYSNGPNTLRGKGDALTLELGRRVPIHCRAL